MLAIIVLKNTTESFVFLLESNNFPLSLITVLYDYKLLTEINMTFKKYSVLIEESLWILNHANLFLMGDYSWMLYCRKRQLYFINRSQ